MARKIAAHRAVAPPAAKPSAPATKLTKVAAGTAIAIVLAVIASNGSYAFLTASHTIPLVPATGSTSATITAGTANLLLSGATITAPNLYPGEVRPVNVSVSTSGTVPLTLGVSSISGTTSTTFTATVAPGPCANNLPAVTSGTIGNTVTPTTPATLCVRIGLAAAAPANTVGANGTIVINLIGTQA